METVLLLSLAAAMLLGSKGSKAAKSDADSNENGANTNQDVTPQQLDISNILPTNNSSGSGTPKYGSPSDQGKKMLADMAKKAFVPGEISKDEVQKRLKSWLNTGSPGYEKYSEELADGLHAVYTTKQATVFAVDTNVDYSIHKLSPPVPANQFICVFSGMVYKNASGKKYMVGYGHRSSLLYYVAVENAVIRTVQAKVETRIVVTDVRAGKYII